MELSDWPWLLLAGFLGSAIGLFIVILVDRPARRRDDQWPM